MLHGPDVSSYQNVVNWAAVKNNGGASFGFCKATEGNYFQDPTFAANWASLQQNGLVRGAYHFAQPGVVTPVDQADYFVDFVDAHGGFAQGDFAVLDIETGNANEPSWALQFMQRLASRVPQARLMIYSGLWFLQSNGFSFVPELANYHLWLADYTNIPPQAPAPWKHWDFWQYTASAVVPGVVSPCDMSVFSGTTQDLTGQQPAPPPPPPPDSGTIVEDLESMQPVEVVRPDGNIDRYDPVIQPTAQPRPFWNIVHTIFSPTSDTVVFEETLPGQWLSLEAGYRDPSTRTVRAAGAAKATDQAFVRGMGVDLRFYELVWTPGTTGWVSDKVE